MKKHIILIVVSLLAVTGTALAQSTAFTYQGRLNENGAPANSTNDFRFRLYLDDIGNVQVGPNVFVDDLVISNGLFTVSLDFGTTPFGGTNLWLDIGVRPGSSSGVYTSLTPLQPLTSAPSAMFANKAGN